MTRLALTLVAWISFVSVASASLTPRKAPRFDKDLPRAEAPKLAAQAPEQVSSREAPAEFAVTRGTEVLLNGKPCRYEDVPEGASIVRMEVATDKKTVLKIHFRARK